MQFRLWSRFRAMGTRRVPKPQTRPRHFLKEWRKYRGLTQQQLADRVETVVSSISQLENGKQGYSQAILEALASALMCEPWDILHVNPLKEGEVVDLTRLLQNASHEQRAEAIGYVKGLLKASGN